MFSPPQFSDAESLASMLWQLVVLSFSYVADEVLWFLSGKLIVTLVRSIRNGTLKGLQVAEPGGNQAFKCPCSQQQC